MAKKQKKVVEKVATGVEYTMNAKGLIVLEFFGNDGKTFNRQPIAIGALREMPFLSQMANVTYDDPERAKATMKATAAEEGKQANSQKASSARKEVRRD